MGIQLQVKAMFSPHISYNSLYAFSDPYLWLSLVIYGIAVVFVFTIPGLMLVAHLKLGWWQSVVVGTILGNCIWVLLAYTAGIAGLRDILIWYIGVNLFLTIYFLPQFMKHLYRVSNYLRSIRRNIMFLIFAIIICCAQISRILYSGTLGKSGLQFFSNNEVGQIAIIDQIVQRLPPYNPGMFGVYIQNYHYLSHLSVSEFVRLFQLPLVSTTSIGYQYYLMIMFIGSLVLFSCSLGVKRSYTWWFVYFSLIPIVYLSNITTDLSLVVFFTALAMLIRYERVQSVSLLIITIILYGTLAGIKIHTAIFAYGGLVVNLLYLSFKRRSLWYVALLAGTLVLASAVYLPTNYQTGGLKYVGFWHMRQFLERPIFNFSPEFLGWFQWSRQLWQAPSSVMQYPLSAVGAMVLYLFFIGLYLIFYYWSYLILFAQTRLTLKIIPFYMHLFFIPVSIACLVLALFFIQENGGSHSAVFFNSVQYILPVYVALAAVYGIKSLPSLPRGLVSVVLWLTVAIVSVDRAQAVLNKPEHIIGHRELVALSFLASLEKDDQLVVVDPNNELDGIVTYVSYLGKAHMFYAQRFSVESHGYDEAGSRRKAYFDLFEQSDPFVLKKILRENRIGYFYLKPGHNYEVLRNPKITSLIYKNETAEIYKVNWQL